ncbi:MAG: hypothetical protein HOM88_05180 [Hellea sp.]|jgi:hypothetical protein|nr:hypothetical protein [Hellea sp.]
MTNQAVAYWIETPLTKVNALIAKYHAYAKDEDRSSAMYDEDANDVMQALSYFRQSDTEALSQHVQFMDTSPREDLIEAFYFDCGKDFVEHVLGYEMSQSWKDANLI